MGPTFIEILHPDDVIVLDSVGVTRCFNDDASHVFNTNRELIDVNPSHT